MRLAAGVLHYAAENGMCAWLRVKLFKEARPKTRAVSRDIAGELVAAAPEGRHRLLLVWLFRMGTRITDTLRVNWDGIDLQRQTVGLRIGKDDNWTELPLHPELIELLAAIPEAERDGRLWPNWTQKTAVYRWLRPLAAELEISFTPHMARHSLGTWLNESGAGLKTIMGALHHRDPKSSLRYQMADVEIIRAATARLPALRKVRRA
jgi:integrase